MGSILLARELPEEGGDTLFANMYRAFETLSPGLQRTLEGMNAVHGSAHIFGAKRRQRRRTPKATAATPTRTRSATTSSTRW